MLSESQLLLRTSVLEKVPRSQCVIVAMVWRAMSTDEGMQLLEHSLPSDKQYSFWSSPLSVHLIQATIHSREQYQNELGAVLLTHFSAISLV